MSEPLEGAAGSKRGRGSKWGRVAVAVAAAAEGGRTGREGGTLAAAAARARDTFAA